MALDQPKPKVVPITPRLFLASGVEVFITQVCLKCHRTKPLRSFGLRRVAGVVRSIPWCKPCRSAYSSAEPKRSRGSCVP